MRKKCSMAILAVALAIVAGCGPSGPVRNAVSGTVKFKGESIKYGSINFRSEGDGKHVGSCDIKEGKYEISKEVGLPSGKYQVAITYPDPKIPAPRADEPPGVATQNREMLPKKYVDGSELKAEIKDGTNDVSFDLK